MEIEIRSETPDVIEQIDLINCRAFREMDESHLVRFMRDYYPMFDRKYSLTAWDGDRMVGHTLFNPCQIRLMGETINALAVAPVSVIPEYQRKGVGGMLLKKGHEMGRKDGFKLAFLLGHPEYYPRYGYIPCYGFSKIIINAENLPAPSIELNPMPVYESDTRWLYDRFMVEWQDVDFAWIWGSLLGEWTFPGTNALVWWTSDGRRAAYTLGMPGKKEYKFILADDPFLAREIIFTIKPEKLEQHPAGWLAQKVLDPHWATIDIRRSNAAMAVELEDGILSPYLQALESGQRYPGTLSEPIMFMLL